MFFDLYLQSEYKDKHKKNREIMKDQKLQIIAVIPARMASKNFPNKPMADINGIPMIGHTYNRVRLCNDITDVYVATADKEIQDYLKSVNASYVDMAESMISATDRVAEAVTKIEQENGKTYDIVVMVQPDEPMVTPDMIGRAISPMVMNENLNVTCLMDEIISNEVFNDRNEIKVVADINNNALYLSREPIPSASRGMTFPRMKLVGVSVFRREFLSEFNVMFSTPLENAEGIDLMRIIENGIKINMTLTDQSTQAVNKPEELEKVKALMKKDYLVEKYGCR